MDKELLKKALLPGIASGLVIALGTVLACMWINNNSFMDSLLSPYGIAAVICFPIVDVFAFYSDYKRIKEKTKRSNLYMPGRGDDLLCIMWLARSKRTSTVRTIGPA